MAEIMGREIALGLATEATRGTAETVADKWFRKVSANVIERAAYAEDDTTTGRIEAGMGRRMTQTYVEGDLSGILHADAFGWLLSNVYGICVSTVVTGSVYSHVFNVKQNAQHTSLTLFAKDGSIQQKTFSNCMINTLSMNVSIDDYIRFSAGFIGSVAASNADTVTYGTEYDFIARDVVIKIAATSGGLTGATALKATAFDITWDQAVIRNHVVGARTPNDNLNSQLMIEGSMTLLYADTTLKDLALSDTARYMQVAITGEADIGSGNFPTITLLMNRVLFSEWERSGENDELVTETVKFRAYFNTTDQKQSQVTLKNLTTAYTNVPTS